MNFAATLGASTSRSSSHSASGAPAIDLRGVHKNFTVKGATVRAVDGIDLTIERGEVVAVLGPNGAGKTTTLDMVLGLTEPTAGTARTFGVHPRESVIAGSVGAVLQSGGLLDDLTVGETVRLVASLHGREIGTPERVAAVMERAGLTPLRNRRRPGSEPRPMGGVSRTYSGTHRLGAVRVRSTGPGPRSAASSGGTSAGWGRH